MNESLGMDAQCKVKGRSLGGHQGEWKVLPAKMRSLHSYGLVASRKILSSLLALIIGVLLSVYAMTIDDFSRYPASSDFFKFYMSAKAFWEGKDIYATIPIKEIIPLYEKLPEDFKPQKETLHPNLNPPFLTLMMAPLGLFSYQTAYWLWSILSLGCGVAGAGLLAREISQDNSKVTSSLGLLVLLLAYFPTWASIVYGQLSLMLFFLLAVGWVAARRGQERLAGIALGLALSMKLFIGLFLIFFAVRRRWRLLCWSVGAALLCGLAGLAVFGFKTHLTYRLVLGNITWYADSWNASFTGFFSRIFGGSENIPLLHLPGLAFGLAHLSSLLLMICLIRLAWPRPQESSPVRFDLGFSLTIVAMFLISPLGWMYYFPALLIPLIVVWRIADNLPAVNRYKLAIAFAWILSTIPSLLIQSSELNHAPVWFTWCGFHFYSLVIISGVLMALGQRLHRDCKLRIPLEGITRS